MATFFNNFLPSNIGGDFIRVRDSSKLTGSTTTSVAVVVIDRILGFGALYVLAVGAYLAGGPAVRGLAGALPALIALGVVFGVARLHLLPARAPRGARWPPWGCSRLPWARSKFEVVQSAVHVYREEVGAVWAALLGSIALQALVVYYYYNIARALRIPLPLSACFLMVPLCSLVQALPISFNGWGVRESVFIVYFAQVGPAARERDGLQPGRRRAHGPALALRGRGVDVARGRGAARGGRAALMAVPVLHVCDKFGVAGSSIHGVSRLFSWWFPRFDRVAVRGRPGRPQGAGARVAPARRRGDPRPPPGPREVRPAHRLRPRRASSGGAARASCTSTATPPPISGASRPG